VASDGKTGAAKRGSNYMRRKIFGPAPGYSLDRNAKAAIIALMVLDGSTA
jgi:hypothetical protein